MWPRKTYLPHGIGGYPSMEKIYLQPVPLSVSYDLEHEKDISVWVLLPMTESAGELHTITLRAHHEGQGLDIHPDDNWVETYCVHMIQFGFHQLSSKINQIPPWQEEACLL